MPNTDPYAQSSETSQGRVFTVTGQDWDSLVSGIAVVGNAGDQ